MPDSKAIRDWTFMVYMAAGDSHKLDTVAVRDLEEMEAGTKGNASVAVVVQINRHWPKSAQRYEVADGQATLLTQLAGRTDMGKRETLTAFLKDVAKDYPARHYCLVLWGHAFGIGYGRDESGPLLLPDLNVAIAAFNEERAVVARDGEARKLDVLGTNACAMSYLEAAFELRNAADLMVASQITVPFVGWPYSVILGRIEESTTPARLSKLIVDAYVTQFDDLPGADRLAMTALNLSKAGDCGDRLTVLATAINEQIDGGFDTETMATLRDVFMGAAAGDVRPLIDLTVLCEILAGQGPDKMVLPIQGAAEYLLKALQPLNPAAFADSAFRSLTEAPLILYRRAHADLVDLKGVGIYAPFITDQNILNRLELAAADKGRTSLVRGYDQYLSLELFRSAASKRRTWPHLVYEGLKRTIPSELMMEIDGIGELESGDRGDVAQIVMSIESVLNGLDRAIARAKTDIVSAIVRGPAAIPVDATTVAAAQGVGTLPATEAKKIFGLPWLRLLPPLGLQALRDADELKKRQKDSLGASYPGADANGRPDVVDDAVDRFAVIELALSATERTVLRALTHARFGLGPMNPKSLLFEPPKAGVGLEPPKAGVGLEPPKAGVGGEPPKAGVGDAGMVSEGAGDLRSDLALRRVADLFRQVGESLRGLEDAATNLEVAARTLLVVSPTLAATSGDGAAGTAQELDRAFCLLEEASANTRRTTRRVFSHPVYGLGPAEEPLTMDVRVDLAATGGLSKRFLKLL